MLRDESGNTDTKVHVEAITDLACGALRNPMPPVLRGLVRGGVLLLYVRTRGELLNFYRLGLGSFYYAVDVYTGNMNCVR